MMITTEEMNTALVVEGLCWSKLPGGPQLVDADDLDKGPSPTARNLPTLTWYAALADAKSKTAAQFATAVRAKYDGDPGPLNDIIAGPDTP